MPDLHAWITQQIDKTSCWLVERGHPVMAELLWRACGLW